MSTTTQQIVKEVNFYGDLLLAIQETKTQKIFVAINYVLSGLGFKEHQIRYTREKWMADKVVASGVTKFSHPSKQGTQDTYCIILNKLPLALAKIRITPTMQKNFPSLSEKLERYQSECADILADAFLTGSHTTAPQAPQAPTSSNPLLKQAMMSLQQSQQNLINCTMEQGYQLAGHEERITQSEELITRQGECLAEVMDNLKNGAYSTTTTEDQELKGVNLIPRLSVQDVVKLNYQEFASTVHSLVIDLSSKRKEVAGHTYRHLYNLIYSNRENWNDMVEAIRKQGLMGFNIENTKLIYEHLPLRKTFVKTLLAALYN